MVHKKGVDSRNKGSDSSNKGRDVRNKRRDLAARDERAQHGMHTSPQARARMP
jgi:hypothetical protein